MTNYKMLTLLTAEEMAVLELPCGLIEQEGGCRRGEDIDCRQCCLDWLRRERGNGERENI